MRPLPADRTRLRQPLATASPERKRWLRRMTHRPTTSAQGDVLIGLGGNPDDVALDRGAASALIDELLGRAS